MINIYPKGYFKSVQEITIQYIIKNKIKMQKIERKRFTEQGRCDIIQSQ